MRSWTTFKTDTMNITDSSAANETIIGTYINDSIRTVCNLQGGKLRFLERTMELKTVANREAYQIPNKFRKVMDVYVTVGDTDSNTNTIYMPEMVFDPTKWKLILAYKLGTNDYPYFAYVQNQEIRFQPIPSSNDNTITLRGRLNVRDLSIEDYSTGTVTSVPKAVTLTAVVSAGDTSATLNAVWDLPTGVYTMFFDSGEQRLVTLTNAATTCTWDDAVTEAATASTTVGTEEGGSILTASGTAFTQDMVGRYIRITETTAANGGDGFWYEIGEYISATVIALTKPYTGTAISAGSAAFTIGQMSPIPEAYDISVVYRSAALYWRDKGSNEKANHFWRLYDGGNEAGFSKEYGGVIGQMLANEGETEEGSYIPPFGGNSATIMQAPYYFPYQQASGFNP